MIDQPPHHHPHHQPDKHEHAHVLAVSVGNSRIKFGLFHGTELDKSEAVPNDRIDEAVRRILEIASASPDCRVVVASVNNPVADRLCAAIDEDVSIELFRLGSDLPIPVSTSLDDDSTVGHDRLLNAIGAFNVSKQACIVIDAGTAVTVDFVDGEGAFQGGVIAPGAQMMLKALHSHTAALPQLQFTPPDPARGPFGKDTAHAMQLGVQSAVRGLVRFMIERYSEAYGAYPRVIATGGSAPALFEHDELIEHIVPDLQLIGIAAACVKLAELDDHE